MLSRVLTYTVTVTVTVTCLACPSGTTEQAQVLRHLDCAKCGEILVQCKVAHFEDLVLEFSSTSALCGACAGILVKEGLGLVVRFPFFFPTFW